MQRKDGTMIDGDSRKQLEDMRSALAKLEGQQISGLSPIFSVGEVVQVFGADGRFGHFKIKSIGNKMMRLKGIPVPMNP